MNQPTQGPLAGSRRPRTAPPPPPSSSLRPLPPRDGPPRRRGGERLLVPFLAGLLGVGAGIGALFAAGVLPAEPPVTIVQPETIERQVVRTEQPFRTATQVAEQVIPSIVEVRIGTLAEGIDEAIPTGSGSGVVYRADGYLITNAHVVQDFDELHAVLADGRSFSAEVVGVDPHTDLAVLRIPASGLSPITLGSSEEARVGDPAIAVGNPLGLEGGPSVTVGVISAFDRRLDAQDGSTLFGMIQTDAPITRGSSGGALVDPIGRLLGITTAIGVSDVGAEGLGFAIPVEVVEEVVQDLIELGDVDHAFLGLEGTTAFRETDEGAEVPYGAVIISLLPGSAIEQSGGQAGDVIVALEGEAVTTMEELVVDLRHHRAGDQVELTVQRGEEQLTLGVVLDRRPGDL
ncbi:MAG: S1C family serine protease [Acidimicrobiia bacterium]